MIERRTNWIRTGLQVVARSAAIGIISLAPCLIKDKAVASVNSEVGSLTTEPILLILDPSRPNDLLRYDRWDLGSIGPRVEVSPEFFIWALDQENIPPKLTLHTKVRQEGAAKVCAYNYPQTKTCHEILDAEINESSYPIDTAALDPGKVYIEANSTRLKMEGMGKVMIEMEITDDKTKGLLASANTTLSLLDIQGYFPLLSKAGSFSPN